MLYIGFPSGDKRKCNEIDVTKLNVTKIEYFRYSQLARAVDFVTAAQVLVLGDPRAVAGKPGCFGKLLLVSKH